VYLDFFMSQLLARRLQRAGKLSFSMDEKNREDVTRKRTLVHAPR
jgi:hypothetical protein